MPGDENCSHERDGKAPSNFKQKQKEPRLFKKQKSISRIDQPEKHTHGWYVRVRFAGKEHSKFFPDKTFGGKRKAWNAAIEHRDTVEIKVGKPRTDRTVVRTKSRSRGGMVGVRYVVKRTTTVGGDIRENPIYEVTWSPEPNVLQRTSLSVRKYGKREAYRLACALRKEKEAEFYGDQPSASKTSRTARR